MANLTKTDEGQIKVTCDAPRCIQRRQDRGQKNGRYILTLSKVPADDLTITVLCPECGANHTLTFSKPAQPTLAQTVQAVQPA